MLKRGWQGPGLARALQDATKARGEAVNEQMDQAAAARQAPAPTGDDEQPIEGNEP